MRAHSRVDCAVRGYRRGLSGDGAVEMFILQDGLLMEYNERGLDLRVVHPINIVGSFVAARLQDQRTSTFEAAVQSKLLSLNGETYLGLLNSEEVGPQLDTPPLVRNPRLNPSRPRVASCLPQQLIVNGGMFHAHLACQ